MPFVDSRSTTTGTAEKSNTCCFADYQEKVMDLLAGDAAECGGASDRDEDDDRPS